MFAGACAVALMKRITDHDTGSLLDWCVQGDPVVTVDYRVRDGLTPTLPPLPAHSSPFQHPHPPPHPPRGSPGPGSRSKSTPDQHCQPGGNKRAVSSSVFISIGDLWTCFASLCFFMLRLNIVYLHN